jgi:RNA polymerase sigma-B factor
MRVRDTIEALTDRDGRTPTVREVASKLDLTDEEVLEAMQATEARRTVSLDAPHSTEDDEGASPMIERVGTTELGFGSVDSQLAAGAAALDERELRVLRMRFGADMTQAEIGRELGVSQMQISRIMRRALKKLLEAVRDDEPHADEGRELALAG